MDSQEDETMDGLKVLVVDDEARMRKLVKDFLTVKGFQVLEAGDGEEAVDIFFKQKDIALIILDVMMPKMDGITALKTLRARGNTTPVLILSAKSEIDDKVLGLDSGANDYLTKPFDAKELLARIRAITRIQNTGTSSQITYGNITLDCATYELSSASSSFKLANREFQMMELLIANPTHLIPTQRFLEKIWGYDSDVEINVVWVYISYLRKKLDALGATIQIKAVRNAGYFLEEKA